MLERLIAILGWEAVLALARAHGGQRLYISTTATHTPVASLLGPTGYAALTGEFAGERIEIPTFAAVQRARAMTVVDRMLRAGDPIRSIARRTGISRRSITRRRRAMGAVSGERS